MLFSARLWYHGAMDRFGGGYSGFNLDDALFEFSDERGILYKSGKNDRRFEDVGPRRDNGANGSRVYRAGLLRVPPLDRFGVAAGEKCQELFALSDRIEVSVQVSQQEVPGYVDLEIRGLHGASATPLFRAQFQCGTRPGMNSPEWLVTLSGFVASDWEIHVSFVPQAGAPPDVAASQPTAKICTHVSVDRAGSGAVGDGSFFVNFNEPIVNNNNFAPIIPVLSRQFAVSGTIANPAYFPAAPTWAFPFVPDGVAFALNSASTDPLWISFDGINDAVLMVPGTPTASFSMPTSLWRFWARSPTGNPVSVQILATRGGGV